MTGRTFADSGVYQSMIYIAYILGIFINRHRLKDYVKIIGKKRQIYRFFY